MNLGGGDGIGQPLPPWMRKGGKKGGGRRQAVLETHNGNVRSSSWDMIGYVGLTGGI